PILSPRPLTAPPTLVRTLSTGWPSRVAAPTCWVTPLRVLTTGVRAAPTFTPATVTTIEALEVAGVPVPPTRPPSEATVPPTLLVSTPTLLSRPSLLPPSRPVPTPATTPPTVSSNPGLLAPINRPPDAAATPPELPRAARWVVVSALTSPAPATLSPRTPRLPSTLVSTILSGSPSLLLSPRFCVVA